MDGFITIVTFAVIGLLIYVLIAHTALFFLAVGAIVIGWFAYKANKNAQADRERIAAEERSKQLAAAEAERYRLSQIEKANSIASQYSSLQSHLEPYLDVARTCLIEAKGEFEERAFAPFWDAIEGATKSLASFHSTIQQIPSLEAQYSEMRRQIGGNLATLPTLRIPNPDFALKQLNDIVRKAQKDFQFSTIYEQRKTNELLRYGFQSLSDALNNISYSMEDTLSRVHSVLYDHRNASAVHFQNVEEMLDNIQRRKRPAE